MNKRLNTNWLKFLTTKKTNEGFTLIELLVVVIIIGVLAAIALPNLLGQVGKARESEAKSTLGAMNRAQQAFFAEKSRFAGSPLDGSNFDELTQVLEVPTGNEKFYYIRVVGPGLKIANGATDVNGNGKMELTEVSGDANGKNGTRDYIAGIAYDPENRIFDSAVCRAANTPAMKSSKYVLSGSIHEPNNTDSTNVADVDVTCAADTEEIK